MVSVLRTEVNSVLDPLQFAYCIGRAIVQKMLLILLLILLLNIWARIPKDSENPLRELLT